MPAYGRIVSAAPPSLVFMTGRHFPVMPLPRNILARRFADLPPHSRCYGWRDLRRPFTTLTLAADTLT